MKRNIFIFFILLLPLMSAFSQVDITGIVKDTQNEPLPGASIVIKGSTSGTVTNLEGRFSISVPNRSVTIIVSYIGYLQKEINIGEQNTYEITLSEDFKNLEEVVVIGYGTVKKSDLTGSVSSVTSEELEKESITTVEQGLQGRVAGVLVTQTDASPGGGLSIQIRGSNSMLGGTEPLYVIDGVPVSSNNQAFAPAQYSGGDSGQDNQESNILSSLNPSDIESIEILKDASATAIYGSRGANGVVMITTKRGKEGQSNITLNASFGISRLANKIDVLDPITYANYINEGLYNNVSTHPITGAVIHGDPVYFDRDTFPEAQKYIPTDGEGTDWQDAIYRTAYTQDYGLGFSGGSSKIRYTINGEYLDKDGIIVNSKFQRRSLRINLDSDIKKYLSVGTSTFISSSDNRMVPTSTRTDGNYGGIVKQALTSNPVKDIDDWDPNVSPEEEETGSNPYVEATEPYNKRNDLRLISDNFAILKFTNWLSLRTNLAINYNKAKRENYYPKTTYRGYREQGTALIADSEVLSTVSETQLNATKQFGNHTISGVGVFSWEGERYYTESMQSSRFLRDDLMHYAIGDGDQTTYKLSNELLEKDLLSLTARVMYNYANRYLLTGTLRRDGASVFGDGNKWALFPSFAMGWRISEEAFFQSVNSINNLKLRISWGQSGNQAIRPLQSKSLLNYSEYPFDYPGTPNLQPAYLDYYAWFPNRNLQWETTTQTNIGLDLGFLENRFTLTFDYYNKLTDDLLQYVLTAFSSGFTQGLVNSGEIQNKGIELSLGANILTGPFQWEVLANYSRNRNEIISIAPGYERQFGPALGEGSMKFSPFIQQPGLPLGAIWGYVEDGIFQNEEEVSAFKPPTPNLEVGEIRYRDISGPDGVPDSTINDYDRALIGDVNPDFIFGITNNFSWKNFDLSILLQGVIGQDILNQTNMRIAGTYDSYSNITREAYENRWLGEGNSNSQPQAKIGTGRSLQFSDRFVEDGSFVRIKNIRLSYTLLKIPAVQSLQLYANITNLFTFTEYSGYDPEVSAFGQDPSRRGVDAGSYPFSRTLTFGFNLTF